jgi:hypothetical protein
MEEHEWNEQFIIGNFHLNQSYEFTIYIEMQAKLSFVDRATRME